MPEFVDQLRVRIREALKRPAKEVFDSLVERGFIDKDGRVTKLLGRPRKTSD